MEQASPAQSARVLEIVRHELDQPELDADALQADHPRWDSAAMVNILFEIEAAFGVVFTSEQMEAVSGVASLCSTLAAAQRTDRRG